MPACSINDAGRLPSTLDTHEVSPRSTIISARFAPCSDMIRPVSLLPPGPGMGPEWPDCSGPGSQVSSSRGGVGFTKLLGPGSN